MKHPRIALIGARRVRQGLGPYVARDLAGHGAEIPAVLGTTRPTAEAAARDLQQYGIECRPYADLDQLLDCEQLDALAILSPPETHEGYLRQALAADLHVLCEKPLIWGREGLAARTATLTEQFRKRGLVLFENCQWPFVLPAFNALHPGALAEPLERFEMWLSPTTLGEEMLRDSMSHPLSLLQALRPDPAPGVGAIEFREVPGRLTVRAEYRTAAAAVPFEVEFQQSLSVPRKAGLAVNGRRAERLVRGGDYSMFFSSGDESVEIDDPLGILLGRFVRELASGSGSQGPGGAFATEGIASRMEMLQAVLQAYRLAYGRGNVDARDS